jgi:hypothetical protein
MHGSNNVLEKNLSKKFLSMSLNHKTYGTNKIEKLKNINMQSIKYF